MTIPTGRTIIHLSREEALHKFWRAERDAGADNITATERMGDFAKQFDAMQADDAFNRDLEIIRRVLGGSK